MATYAVGIIILVIMFFALKSTVRHFRGEGSCCGVGDVPALTRKKMDAPKIGEKVVSIEGMHCQNCKRRVETLLNGIEGAVAKVDLGKNIAILSMSRIVADEEIYDALDGSEFRVVSIQAV